MNNQSKKITDRLNNVPTTTVLIESPKDREAKTGPGQMMQFMAKESQALIQNDALKAEIAALKAPEIALSSITIVDGRRRKLSPQKYAELVENLKNNKLATPITVRSTGGGKFELISGHNRYQAFADLGRESIPAFVVDLNDIETVKGAFYANLLSETLPDYEKYKGFKEIMGKTGQTQAELAKEAGITAATMSLIMEFDKLPKEAIQLIEVRPDAIGYTALSKLKKLPGMMDGIKAIVEKQVTLSEAVAIASATKMKTAGDKPVPVVIKNGREHIAELIRREGVVSIRFKDASVAQKLVADIEELIRLHIKTMSANS